jgi:hypothetical protein
VSRDGKKVRVRIGPLEGELDASALAAAEPGS